ncbi:unnamed protein product [Cylicocyclus nassatus]|uniref:Uncharacterized protein n=1 Tax=Cylicocyclus nassatus TaxID=53992 RepID=A0AA36GEP9_CYLNA|nr:unnamed protein product [Cylicocyclus nassatus]
MLESDRNLHKKHKNPYILHGGDAQKRLHAAQPGAKALDPMRRLDSRSLMNASQMAIKWNATLRQLTACYESEKVAKVETFCYSQEECEVECAKSGKLKLQGLLHYHIPHKKDWFVPDLTPLINAIQNNWKIATFAVTSALTLASIKPSGPMVIIMLTKGVNLRSYRSRLKQSSML